MLVVLSLATHVILVASMHLDKFNIHILLILLA